MKDSERTSFLFAPGAGAPSSHPWMRHFSALLRELGEVHTFDYNYMREARRRPDPLPQLIARHREALAEAASGREGAVVLIGKSMGGRIGCHVALEVKVAAVVCLGYPLCAMGDCNKLRDQVLLALQTPILFVQGTRDMLCPLDLLAGVRAKMSAVNQLHVVEGGDHSLRLRATDLRQSKQTQDEVDRGIVEQIAAFTRRHSFH